VDVHFRGGPTAPRAGSLPLFAPKAVVRSPRPTSDIGLTLRVQPPPARCRTALWVDGPGM